MAKKEAPASGHKKTGPVDITEQENKKEIQVIERIIENREIAPADAFGKLTRAQIELLKRTIAKGASDDELRLFVQVCKGSNLNPFLRQAHLIPYWDSKAGAERRVVVVGIDGFRAIAESGGQYAGNDDAIFAGEHELTVPDYDKDKGTTKQIKAPGQATVSVYKVIGGARYPFTATARWDEYYPGLKKGFQWHKMPYLLLSKCAEALALRKGFPKLLSGIYAQEEFDQAMQGPSPEQLQAAQFAKLMEAVEQSTDKQLTDYLAKIEKSDKYTKAQKAEFKKAAQAKIKQLQAAAKETPPAAPAEAPGKPGEITKGDLPK